VSLKLDKEAGEIVGWEKFWEVLDTDKGLSNKIKEDLKDKLPQRIVPSDVKPEMN
jgi:hypothetical protein